jgi:hypothetical protein
MLPTTVRAIQLLGWYKVLTRLDARGHYTIGKEMVDSVIDRIRKVAGKQPPYLIEFEY